MVNRAAGPTSVNRPKLVLLLITAARTELPLSVMLPVAKGLLAVGRTRTFCQVSEQLLPPWLAMVIVKVICVVEREVIATEVPLLTPLMLWAWFPAVLSSVIRTVGAVPPESKMNPDG